MKYALVAIIVIILIAIVGGAAYYFGLKSSGNNNNNLLQPQPTTAATKPTVQPTKTSADTKEVTAGGVLVFPAYTVDVPLVWNALQTRGTNSNTLSITNNAYKIVISQAASGGGGCTYPQETPAEMAQTFSSFVEITDSNGYVFRRGPTEGSANTWTVCQKESDSSFGFPTIFGNITITTPSTTTDEDMMVVDGIISSLKKQ